MNGRGLGHDVAQECTTYVYVMTTTLRHDVKTVPNLVTLTYETEEAFSGLYHVRTSRPYQIWLPLLLRQRKRIFCDWYNLPSCQLASLIAKSCGAKQEWRPKCLLWLAVLR